MNSPGGPSDIWVMDADGRTKIRLTDGYSANYAPTFDAAGRLYFTASAGKKEHIWSLLPARNGLLNEPEMRSAEHEQTRETMAETIIGPEPVDNGD